jgi:anthranilate synthase component 1
VGYAAYDSVHADVGGHIAEPSCFGFYPGAFVYDHVHDTLTYRCLPGHEGHDVDGIVAEARTMEVGLCQNPSSIRRTDADRACYEDMVERARDYVFAGDVFQVVLSREYEVSTPMSPFEAYLRLRGANPSPYLFLIEFERMKVAGSSPETMVRVEGDTLHINPIAGTTTRGASHAEDGALATRLLQDEKERAEHVMLVDLARNDARKVALPGSVHVPTYMEVVPYARVQHIESEVVAKLRPDATMYDALAAAFPAGTLSGAPKVRAMEVISELERSPRRAYGGCAGYFSLNGTADTAIAIRMIQFDKACRVRAGAGIVADSVPSTEFDETEKKMSAVLSALNVEGGI